MADTLHSTSCWHAQLKLREWESKYGYRNDLTDASRQWHDDLKKRAAQEASKCAYCCVRLKIKKEGDNGV